MKRSLLSATTLSLRAKRRLRASNLSGAFAVSALLAMPSAQAANLYWDVDGATAGFSTVAGAWNGTNTFWNTDSAGGAGTLSQTPTSADDLFIPQATTNTGSITLSGATKNASSITFAADVGPTTTLTGGTLMIGGTGAFSGIRQQSTGANTISSALQLNSANTAFNFSNSSSGLLTIGGAVTGTDTSGNVTQTLSIGSSSSGGITFGGIIADVSGSATKVALTVNNTSTGVTTLSGANTYTGLTTVSAGTLLYGASNVIGTGSITVSGTGILNLGANQSDSIFGTVTLRGSGQINGSGSSTLTSTSTFRVESGSVSAILAGNGVALNKTTAGTVTLSGVNTYTGPTVVSAGTLAYGASDVIGTGAVTVNGATAILNLGANQSDSVGTVTLQGGGQINGSGTSTLTSTGTFEMQSGSVSAILAGAVPLNKTSSGTVTLSGANTYTGATTVAAGQLVVNGSSSSSAHTVGSTGTLGGSGTVGALLVQSGGTISPGNSPGILNVNGNTSWQNGGNYNWQLLDATGAAGTGWDQLAISGALDLASLTAGGFNVNVWSLSSALVNGNAQNFDGIGGVYSWPIATTTTGITGFDAGDFTIFTGSNNGTNGFTNSFAGGTFSMSQTGNNLYLNYGPTPVPEPASALTVLALFSGAVLQRRKRAVK